MACSSRNSLEGAGLSGIASTLVAKTTTCKFLGLHHVTLLRSVLSKRSRELNF